MTQRFSVVCGLTAIITAVTYYLLSTLYQQPSSESFKLVNSLTGACRSQQISKHARILDGHSMAYTIQGSGSQRIQESLLCAHSAQNTFPGSCRKIVSFPHSRLCQSTRSIETNANLVMRMKIFKSPFLVEFCQHELLNNGKDARTWRNGPAIGTKNHLILGCGPPTRLIIEG